MYYIQENTNQFESPIFEVMKKEPFKNGFKISSYSGVIHSTKEKAEKELKRAKFINA